jgi:hypothetical protein
MHIDGNSMKVAGILDGDLPAVDRAAKPVNGTDGSKRGHGVKVCADLTCRVHPPDYGFAATGRAGASRGKEAI